MRPRMDMFFGALLLGLALAGPASAQTIEGRWRLIAAEDLRADGTVGHYQWGEHAVGSFIVQDGLCWFQMMNGDVPSFPGGAAPADRMQAALGSTYLAYTGPCRIETPTGGKLTLQVTGASVADYPSPQTRYVRVVGDTLYFGPTERVLTSPPWSDLGTALVRRLRFAREK